MMQQGISAKKKSKRKQNAKLRDSLQGQIDSIRRSASTEFLSGIPRGSLILPFGTWKKTRYVTREIDGVVAPSVVNAIKYTFRWKHGGRKIYLSGSFANVCVNSSHFSSHLVNENNLQTAIESACAIH